MVSGVTGAGDRGEASSSDSKHTDLRKRKRGPPWSGAMRLHGGEGVIEPMCMAKKSDDLPFGVTNSPMQLSTLDDLPSGVANRFRMYSLTDMVAYGTTPQLVDRSECGTW